MGFVAAAAPAIAGWFTGAGAAAGAAGAGALGGAAAAGAATAGAVGAGSMAAYAGAAAAVGKTLLTNYATQKATEAFAKPDVSGITEIKTSTSGIISNSSNAAQKEYLRREKLKQGFASTIKASSGVNKLSPNNISRPALTGIATKRLLGQ